MMRIGYLVPEFPAQTHIFFWREVEALRRLGADVCLFSTRRPPHPRRHAFAARAEQETLYLFPPRLLVSSVYLACHPLLWLRMLAYILQLEDTSWTQKLRLVGLTLCAAELLLHAQRLQLEHIHGHSCGDVAHLLALSSLSGRLPYSLSLHGDLVVYGTDHRSKFQRAAFVAVVTQALQEQVHTRLGLSRQRLPLIRMGVQVERFCPADRQELRQGELRLITVARLDDCKGHVFALEAMRRAIDQGTQLRYTIVGAGTHRPVIESDIERLGLQQQVQLTGTASEDEVLRYLQEADAFVLPSVGFGEAAPVSVMEAMACGLPVIASRIGGTPELITHGVDGFLVEQRDSAGLSACFVQLAQDLSQRVAMGQQARQTAETRFAADAFAAEFLTMVRRTQSASLPYSETLSHSPALRLLILCEKSNPDWVSVPLVGYLHAAALARSHEVTLVTHVRNLPALLAKPQPFHAIIACELPLVDRLMSWALERIFRNDFGSQSLTALNVPFYLLFEWQAWRKLKDRIRQGDFDIVLRLTPVAPVLPSLMSWLLRQGPVPFVIGPINGGLAWPEGFTQAERQKEWISGFRALHRYVPFIRSTYRHAAAIIVGSSQTYAEYAAYAPKLFFLPENGIQIERLVKRKAERREGPLQLIFVGRLVPFKACDLALRAAQTLLLQGHAHFTVVGDGPERQGLEALVADLGIKAAVDFTGALPHAETMQYFARADILVFPSIREFGGGVVFEALAHGVVPIVADYGGPGDIVHAAIGFKVRLTNETEMIEELSAALGQLHANRQHLRTLAEQGQNFALDHLTWDSKALQMTAILLWCLRRGPKPTLIPQHLRSGSSQSP